MLCVIDVFSKYVSIKALKDKKAKTVLHGFAEIVNKSKRKPNKLLVYQRKEFYNSPMQKWLDNNDTLMYSTYNEGKSLVAKRFIRTSKSEISRKTTANNEKPYLVCLNKLEDE